MTKDNIKKLCEDDGKLQWWAMVLFAEISELAGEGSGYRNECHDKTIANYVRAKVDEFPGLVVQRALEKVNEKSTKTEETTPQ